MPFLKQTGGRIVCNARNLTVGGVPIADVHATAAMENGQIRLFPVSALIPGGTLSADLRGEVRGQALDLTAEAEIADTAPGLSGSGKKDDGSAPRASRLILNGTLEATGITGNLALNSPDPLAAARALGLAVKYDAAGQGPPESSIRTAFTLVPDHARAWGRLELKGLHARIGPGEVDGGLTVTNAPVPAVNLDLRLAALDEKIMAAFSGLAGSPGDDRPRTPRLDLDGRIAVDKAVLYGVEAKNVSIAGTATQDKIEAASIGADLFGGRLSGRAELALGDQANRLSVNASLAGADAAAMTNKLLAGPCTVTAIAEGEGRTLADLLGALKGRIEAEMNKDPKAHKAGEAAFSKLKADIGFKGRAPRPENGAADPARAFDLTSAVTVSGPETLREVKTDIQAVAAFGQDGVQIGQGKLSGTAGIFVPGEKAGRNLPVTFAAGFSADLGKGAFAAPAT
jgi:AsmA protein